VRYRSRCSRRRVPQARTDLTGARTPDERRHPSRPRSWVILIINTPSPAHAQTVAGRTEVAGVLRNNGEASMAPPYRERLGAFSEAWRFYEAEL
jgi:hypothetical protein